MNPYAPVRSKGENLTQKPLVVRHAPSFSRGFGRGLRWSLVLAVPAFLALYFDYSIRLNYEVDPATGAFRIRTDFTLRDYLRCALHAAVPVTAFIMIPWAVALGILYKRRVRLQS
ncbi:hypothetical protein Pla52n_47870 [Stieleria varia]|uniref:Uncharacterized protein n=1 Tax=Stieleria varia TaxID=2528005 RepID=A0A5C6AFS2_9BACT|nr:hypothetical protein Pla52n_47870 [Stieleria varia]